MKKKPTINSLNDDDKYFQYAATVALIDEEVTKNIKSKALYKQMSLDRTKLSISKRWLENVLKK